MRKKTLHLLMLEDSSDDAELAVQELERQGFIVEWSRVETEEAFREALDRKPDLILADYVVLSFSGTDASKIQQEIAPGIPLVIISGTIGEEVAVECMKFGAADYVLKDRLFRLGPVVKRALEEAQVYRERKRAQEELIRLSNAVRMSTDSIVVSDLEGKIIDVNEATLEMHGTDDKADLIGKSSFDLIAPKDREKAFVGAQEVLEKGYVKGQEYHIITKNGSRISVEMSVAIMKDAAGEPIGFVGVTRGITERQRAEEELRRVSRALRVLSECNQAVVRATEELPLLHEVCRLIVDVGEYPLAWVGFAEQDEEKTVRPVAQAGFEEGCLDTANITWADTERGRGPTGTAIRTGKPYIARDILTDPNFAPWREAAIQRGYVLSAALPLLAGEQVFGALNIYAVEPDAFDVEEVKLLTELADDLAFGIVALRTRAERKQAEEALRESEERYRDLIESTYDLIQSVAPDGRFIFVNRAWLETLGYTEAELPSLDLWKIIHPESLLHCRKTFSRVAAGESIQNVQATFVTKDGRAILVEGNVTGRYIGDRLVATHGFFRDITERVRAEQALQQSEERYRAVVEYQTDLICRFLPDGTLTFVNQAYCLYHGKQREELVGHSFMPLILPEYREKAAEHLASFGPERPVATIEYRVVAAGGKVRWQQWINRPIFDEQGDLIEFQSVGRDVTERKQAQGERDRLLAQIQEQAQQVQQIIDTVPEGVLLLDSDGLVILANPLGKKYLVALADAQVGDVLTRLGDRPLAELLTSPPKGLWHEVATNGRSFEVIARPMEVGPETTGWVLVVRDVTREREIQRYSQQQEKLATVGQLAAGIAHDFNNIMATIILYAQMLSQAEDMSPRSRERLATVNQQATHAVNLIRQILDFSRRSMLERQPMNLLLILKEQVKLLERTLPENVKIILAYGWDEYTINADPTRMQQVMMNLALNARDAMPEGGSLRFGLERIQVQLGESPPLPEMEPGEWVQVTVSDTGTGIPPDVLPHIFDPFFTTKAPGEGTGLGLAQVYGIVKQHEGEIDVQSPSTEFIPSEPVLSEAEGAERLRTGQVGQGTTFTIYLPALPVRPAEAVTLELPALAKGRGETILVVEDNTTTRQALVESLELLNYRVLAAADGQEALAILEQHGDEVALLLSDVVMPGMGGIALLHALRQRGLAVKVVMLTGHPMEREMEGLRAQGMSDWLPKPPRLEQLAEVVARILNL